MNGRSVLSRQELTDILHDLGLWTDLTSAAFSLAEGVHGNQRRAGGGPYLEEHIYPVTESVARFLAHNQSEDDETSVIVSLLHDTIEDSTTVTTQSIDAEFGSVIAQRVSILTKPDKRPGAVSKTSDEDEARYVTGIARADFSVRVIKIFDRLNNLAAVHHREPSRRRTYLQETRKHYVALARSVDEALADRMVELLNEQESQFNQETAE